MDTMEWRFGLVPSRLERLGVVIFAFHTPLGGIKSCNTE